MKLRNKKTGEIDEFLFEVINDRIDLYRRVGTSETKNVWTYHSLDELNKEWEDYTPAEPLIKDEKIRKAVRAWAGLYDDSVIRIHLGEDYVSLYIDEVNGYSSSVGIDLSHDVFRELIDAHYYTIDELCGEEEE